MKQRTLLCVVAHPDDETFGAGTTLIHAASLGIKTVTLCATRGEAGEIMERSGATPETLPAVREAEYRTAGRIMGVSESLLMGYRDSGMAGTPENDDPNAFIRQSREKVIADILDVMERVRPDVLLTGDTGGGYGHPDHIFATECATAAFQQIHAERDQRGWVPSKHYFYVFPQRLMRKFWESVVVAEPDSGMAAVDPSVLGVPDETVTLTMDMSVHEVQAN
jgi:LmbE family N-acetylglucosaminyl deacetylase